MNVSMNEEIMIMKKMILIIKKVVIKETINTKHSVEFVMIVFVMLTEGKVVEMEEEGW